MSNQPAKSFRDLIVWNKAHQESFVGLSFHSELILCQKPMDYPLN